MLRRIQSRSSIHIAFSLNWWSWKLKYLSRRCPNNGTALYCNVSGKTRRFPKDLWDLCRRFYGNTLSLSAWCCWQKLLHSPSAGLIFFMLETWFWLGLHGCRAPPLGHVQQDGTGWPWSGAGSVPGTTRSSSCHSMAVGQSVGHLDTPQLLTAAI